MWWNELIFSRNDMLYIAFLCFFLCGIIDFIIAILIKDGKSKIATMDSALSHLYIAMIINLIGLCCSFYFFEG